MLTNYVQGENRVYVDDALYGEGIAGDIRSLGHHEAHWDARGARNDMKLYFSKLSAAAAKVSKNEQVHP